MYAVIYTITLSLIRCNDEGALGVLGHIRGWNCLFFWRNEEGALGLGHNKDVSVPTPIPNLPKINMISCGHFIVCGL